MAKSKDTATSAFRFVAALPEESRSKALSAAAELALDRLPDAQGKLQLLISADDARRLLERGIQVHLQAVLPVTPLDQKLVFSDKAASTLLERRVKSVARKAGA
jgi:hypothetical protein